MPSVPNFKLITPAEREKLAPLLRHYAKSPHPFTACVRDNTKRFGKDRAERICAVVKDTIRGTTSWRGKEMSEGQLRTALVELSRANIGRVTVERDTDPDVIELASSGLVPVKVTVHRKNGTTFQRTMMVRPNQAKAMKAGKGGQQVSVKGLKASRHETRVLQELAKIPKADRPAGWDRVVRAVATGPSHGGRLGPEKRRLLRDLQANAPAGSPLKAAVTAALQADAKPAKPKAKPRHKTTQGRAKRAAGKVVAGGR